jgi:hypothetical protein
LKFNYSERPVIYPLSGGSNQNVKWSAFHILSTKYSVQTSCRCAVEVAARREKGPFCGARINKNKKDIKEYFPDTIAPLISLT